MALKKPPDVGQAYGVFMVKLCGARGEEAQRRRSMRTRAAADAQVDAVVERVDEGDLVVGRPRVVALEVDEARAAGVRGGAIGAVLVRDRELAVVQRELVGRLAVKTRGWKESARRKKRRCRQSLSRLRKRSEEDADAPERDTAARILDVGAIVLRSCVEGRVRQRSSPCRSLSRTRLRKGGAHLRQETRRTRRARRS